MSSVMSADQSHHYLTQSYQRGWLDASGRTHVYRWVHTDAAKTAGKLVCEPKSTKSTGARDGLYFIPMAPPDEQNFMEDVFWKEIDQWGADGLALLRSADPAAPSKVNKVRLATFVMSFLFRNPNMVRYFNARAIETVLNGCLKDDYAANRMAHEPVTFEEFKVALEQPGMTELAAKTLRAQVLNREIISQLLTMAWAVVTVPPTSDPILTSDVPIIVFKGLRDDDGLLILPLSTNEFFVAHNNGWIDMKHRIDESVATGRFVRSMNKYVVEHRIDYVYGVDTSLMDFVARYWGVSNAPFFPSLANPVSRRPGT